MATEFEHRPVLFREALANLELHPGQTVVDGTLGGGGHARGILEATAPDGRLIGLDRDSAAREAARENLREFGERATLVAASFRDLGAVLQDLGLEAVDGVLLDLGVSSHQLDVSARGFRFADADAPLDMRMDPSQGASARELLRDSDEAQLADWFHFYGELRGARKLARVIVERRREVPLETAGDLLALVRDAGVGGGRKHNPATLVFQALRIAVNDELSALEEGLAAAVAALRPGGRLVVIAYHSLEDRRVKHFLRDEARGCICPPRIPACVCGRLPTVRLCTRKPIRPAEAEVAANPRARSALLRAAERLPEAA